MKSLVLLVLFSIFSMNFSAFAGTCDGSTQEMIGCYLEKAAKSQEGIDQSTIQLKAILEENKNSGDGEPSDYDAAKVTLDIANSKFAELIGNQCELEGNLETMTGTLANVVHVSCLAKMTEQRNKSLKKLVKSHAGKNK